MHGENNINSVSSLSCSRHSKYNEVTLSEKFSSTDKASFLSLSEYGRKKEKKRARNENNKSRNVYCLEKDSDFESVTLDTPNKIYPGTRKNDTIDEDVTYSQKYWNDKSLPYENNEDIKSFQMTDSERKGKKKLSSENMRSIKSDSYDKKLIIQNNLPKNSKQHFSIPKEYQTKSHVSRPPHYPDMILNSNQVPENYYKHSGIENKNSKMHPSMNYPHSSYMQYLHNNNKMRMRMNTTNPSLNNNHPNISSGPNISHGESFPYYMSVSPSYPPSSVAQLRVILLIGLISSRTENLENYEKNLNDIDTSENPNDSRFQLVFVCPIHSSSISRFIQNLFIKYLGYSRTSVTSLNGPLIAEELYCLSCEFNDPIIGTVNNLLSIDIVTSDSVVVKDFDYHKCLKLVRCSLRPNHPSQSILLWDSMKMSNVRRLYEKLSLGVGLGVESRYKTVSSLLSLKKDVFYEINRKCIVESHPAKPLDSHNVDFNDNSNISTYGYHSNKLLAGNQIPMRDNGFGQNSDSLKQSYSNSKLDTEMKNFHPKTLPSTSLFNNYGHFRENTYGSNQAVSNKVMSCNEMFPGYNTINQHSYGQTPTFESGNISRKLNNNISESNSSFIEDLLNAPSVKEQQLIDTNAELRQLLAIPTAKHYITTKSFQNQGGSRVQQICPHGTRRDCLEASIQLYNHQRNKQCHIRIPSPRVCQMVHFKRILLPHTDASLGDCSYLDTCRHMSSCRFVHYEIDLEVTSENQKVELLERMENNENSGVTGHNIGTVFSGHLEALPAQWITCDVRKFDWSIFKGKVKILMADPPWDIHMDLPYGTMTDAEMKAMRLDQVQDEGCLFLWVTGRAMELGRECLKLWGYRQVEEIVWIKTNQLHRIIRTGRTGHWLNHSKEHCLVGIKGNPKLNCNLDADTIVAEVRETSRKPDEIYRIMERLCPGPYKLELFGRPHNVRENWITLGNQLSGVYLHDSDLIYRYNNFVTANGLPTYNVKNETESPDND